MTIRHSTPKSQDFIGPRSVTERSLVQTIDPEFPFGDELRLLLTIAQPDRDGLLGVVLGALEEEIELSDRGESESPDPLGLKASFSIDGSMVSTMSGTAVAVILLKIVESDTQPFTSYSDHLKERLKERVLSALEENFDNVNGESVGVDLFEKADNSLLAGRRFSEYWFGLPNCEGVSKQLSRLAGRFAAQLGEMDIPIAYLQVPAEHDGEDSTRWLQVSVGAPRRAVDSMTIDLQAAGLAEEYRALYKKLNPLWSDCSEDRFVELADYSDRARKAPSPSESRLQVDVLFVKALARPGLMGYLLNDTLGAAPLAVSMRVVAGHTVCSLVVEADSGDDYARSLRQRWIDYNWGRAEPEIRTLSQSHVQDSVSVSGESRSIWLSWSCRDQPHVMSAIVRAASQWLKAIFDGPPSVRNALSRIVGEGEWCAGKVSFLLPVGSQVSDPLLRELRKIVAKRVVKDSNVEDIDIRVSTEAPSEDPWISLRNALASGAGISVTTKSGNSAGESKATGFLHSSWRRSSQI